jgi:hypothetical protein
LPEIEIKPDKDARMLDSQNTDTNLSTEKEHRIKLQGGLATGSHSRYSSGIAGVVTFDPTQTKSSGRYRLNSIST